MRDFDRLHTAGCRPDCGRPVLGPAAELALLSAVSSPCQEKKMSVSQEVYGNLPDGTQIDLYTLPTPTG